MARAPMAQSWWAVRFLEGTADGDPGRLSRGRTYARNGSVGQITVSPDLATVSAEVEGSRRGAYYVSIAFQSVSDQQWEHVLSDLAQDPEAAAALLDAHMPDGMEEIFARHGVAMFPDSLDDLDLWCTCPDRGHPCKHAAAVLYSVARIFDEDPAALLTWLGRTEDEVLQALDLPGDSAGGQAGELDVDLTPLAEHVDDFWAPAEPVPMAPPRPFDPVAHWEGATSGVVSRLAPMYALLERPES